ncbi:MAG TPA: hypothetical protein VGC41_18875 [Kofleriaceae bacterium]
MFRELKTVIAMLLVLAAPAVADRCAEGMAFAKSGDLPRAALYLDGCTDEEAVTAAHGVAKKLEASQLSALVISGDGIAFTISALPNEKLTAPATVWTKAGTITITVGDRKLETAIGAHSRSSILLEKPRAVSAPKAGTVNISDDEPTDSNVTGPPPAQKWKSILPCEYEGCNTAKGDLADPLATGLERYHVAPPILRIGARVGVAASESVGMSGAIAAHWSWLAMRGDVSQREHDHMSFTEYGISAGIAHPVWSPRAAWIGLGAALRADTHSGFGANAELELALRQLPITIGARYEQAFDGAYAIVVEVGADWRLFGE